MAAAIASNEREWGWARRGAGTPKDVLEMIERADRERAAAAAAAAARPQPSPVEALAAWAREGQRAAP
jgi:hypothetical protein